MNEKRLFIIAAFSFLTFAAALFAREGGRTILFLGDSLTAGYGIEKNQAYPSLIERKLEAAGIEARVMNAGVSGNTTAGGLHRLDWYFRQRIDILLIALGGNDGLRGLDPLASRKNLQTIIDKARSQYPDITIILAGMQVPPNMGDDYSRRFRGIFSELAIHNDIPFIPFLLEGVGGVRNLNLADGIHPNPEGHKIICEHVWKVLQPLMRTEDK